MSISFFPTPPDRRNRNNVVTIPVRREISLSGVGFSNLESSVFQSFVSLTELFATSLNK